MSLGGPGKNAGEKSAPRRRGRAGQFQKSSPLLLCAVALLASDQRTWSREAEELRIAQAQYFGGDYYTDPTALPNLAEFVSDQTGAPWNAVDGTVSLLDPNLDSYAVLYLTGHGEIQLKDDEIKALRYYLENGGFLLVNDNGPERSGNSINRAFRREIEKVLPDRPLVELPDDHPIYRVYFEFEEGLPQIHRHDENEPPRGYGIYLDRRLAVFYAWNSDIGNGWEDPQVHNDPPEKRMSALRMGANLLVYALIQ